MRSNLNVIENRIFIYALIGSCLLHIALFINFVYIKIPRVHYAKKNDLELIYQSVLIDKKKEPVNPMKIELTHRQNKGIQESKLMRSSKELYKFDSKVPGPLMKDIDRLSGRSHLDLKQTQNIDSFYSPGKITISELKSEKINNPSYNKYFQDLSRRIEQQAHKIYSLKSNYGEVHVAFVLSANGALKQVRLIGQKTSNNLYLQDIGVRSIKNASPFPSFPKELINYPELPFNILISFKERTEE